MKNLVFLFAFLFSLTLMAQGDAPDYIMYQTIHLTPKSGHQQQLMDGLKAHNEKFHRDGMNVANVWSINSGPRSGSMSWVMGPVTWTHFDSPLSDEHTADWMANVDAHAEVGEWEYWRLDNEMSYIPEGVNGTVGQIRFFKIMPQKGNNARQLFKTIFEVYREQKMDIGLHVFTNQAPTKDGPGWAVLWMHENWASLDNDRGFVTKYEEKYGVGSWREFFENWGEVTEFHGLELQSLVPELSAAGSNE